MASSSMSQKLISRNPDLSKLQNDGYEVECRDGYLIVHSVPYVNSSGVIDRADLVSALELRGEQTCSPVRDHQVWFTGSLPYTNQGQPVSGLGGQGEIRQTLTEGVEARYRFSNKPTSGYQDFFQKMSRYVLLLSRYAMAIDPGITAKTFKPIPETEESSPFRYIDSASSRAGITAVSQKLAMDKVAIIGLGGTGSYILDMLAKTPVREIHLFDGDDFQQHNAFRAPGAASIEELQSQPSKVSYFSDMYGHMRSGLVPHHQFIDETTVAGLSEFNFVFICVDKPSVRKVVVDFLIDKEIPYIDVGMEVTLVDESLTLVGTCRTTLGTASKSDHISKYASLAGTGADDLYRSNIQVADLNALNATLAVIKWKKHCGFYQDCYREHQSCYSLNTHQLTRDELFKEVS